MKKAAAAGLLMLTATLLYGCGGQAGTEDFQPDSSSIYVSKDGEVLSALVETYEQGDYDTESLKTFLDGEISSYIQEHPAQEETPAVALKECSVENGKMTAVFEYASPEDMIAFSQAQEDGSMGLTSMEVTDVEKAFSEGQVMGTFVDAADKEVSLTDVMKEDKAVAVITEGEGLIETEGKILFVSQGTQVDPSGNKAAVSGGQSYIIFK